MKTNVVMKNDQHQCDVKKGDAGYIDGYVRALDGIGYACVVVPDKGIVDFVLMDNLKVTGIRHS